MITRRSMNYGSVPPFRGPQGGPQTTGGMVPGGGGPLGPGRRSLPASAMPMGGPGGPGQMAPTPLPEMGPGLDGDPEAAMNPDNILKYLQKQVMGNQAGNQTF
jgi:hypothetical protein